MMQLLWWRSESFENVFRSILYATNYDNAQSCFLATRVSPCPRPSFSLFLSLSLLCSLSVSPLTVRLELRAQWCVNNGLPSCRCHWLASLREDTNALLITSVIIETYEWHSCSHSNIFLLICRACGLVS